MEVKLAEYKQKCNGCRIFFLNSQLHYSQKLGKMCENCLSIKSLQVHNLVSIPQFMTEKLGWKEKERLKLVVKKNSLIIKKHKQVIK